MWLQFQLQLSVKIIVNLCNRFNMQDKSPVDTVKLLRIQHLL